MSKKETVWLIVRIVGVYFGYLALTALFALIAMAPSLIFTKPVLKQTPTRLAPTAYDMQVGQASPAVEPNESTGAAEQNSYEQTAAPEEETLKVFLLNLLMLAVYAGAAGYLLIDGRLLFLMLMREPGANETEREPEVTSLNL